MTPPTRRTGSLDEGSWDLATRVIKNVTLLITMSNPQLRVLIAVLVSSHEPPSRVEVPSLEGPPPPPPQMGISGSGR